jgi:GntR family transcriptional regulator
MPLHHKIYCALRSQIESGQLERGHLVPSEPELEQIFCSSRTPIRQALAQLENEQLIVRRPGKGTFVTSRDDQKPWWLSLSPFRKHSQENWDKARGQFLQVEQRVPPDFVRDFFVLGNDCRVTYIVRRRSVNEKPVIANRFYVHPQYAFREFIEVGKFFSLRLLLMEKFFVEITRIDDELTAILPPDEEIANLLDVPPAQPLLCIRRYMYAEDMPVLVDMTYAVTDIWNYRVTFRKGGGDILEDDGEAE